MEIKNRLATLGLGLWLLAMGLGRLGAPHWLTMALNGAAVMMFVVYLSGRSGLRQRKLAWLRRLASRE